MAGVDVSGIYSATYSSVCVFVSFLRSPLLACGIGFAMALTSLIRSPYMNSKSRVIVLCDGGPTNG